MWKTILGEDHQNAGSHLHQQSIQRFGYKASRWICVMSSRGLAFQLVLIHLTYTISASAGHGSCNGKWSMPFHAQFQEAPNKGSPRKRWNLRVSGTYHPSSSFPRSRRKFSSASSSSWAEEKKQLQLTNTDGRWWFVDWRLTMVRLPGKKAKNTSQTCRKKNNKSYFGPRPFAQWFTPERGWIAWRTTWDTCGLKITNCLVDLMGKSRNISLSSRLHLIVETYAVYNISGDVSMPLDQSCCPLSPKTFQNPRQGPRSFGRRSPCRRTLCQDARGALATSWSAEPWVGWCFNGHESTKRARRCPISQVGSSVGMMVGRLGAIVFCWKDSYSALHCQV